MKTALVGARVFDGHQLLDKHAVILHQGRIEALLSDAELPDDLASLDLSGGILAPGLIDLQVNGGGGKMLSNEPSLASVQAMLSGHRKTGTTSMLPTLISGSRDNQQAGVEAVQHAFQTEAGVLGIHIEGPFFHPQKRGAHAERYIRPLTDEDVVWLINLHKASDAAMMVTLAPEQTQPGQIRRLQQAGITICAGHTDASSEQIEQALSEGLSGFTHLFNAMRPMTGRDPGVVGAALSDDNSWCGIIADGHHVHPTSLRAALNAKPQGKVFLVTDAMSTVGANPPSDGSDKSFDIYNETIFERDGRLVNAEGRLAGSAIGMIDAVRFSCEHLHLSLEESLRMGSLYPAQFIGQDHQLGKIEYGYRADLFHFTDNFQVTRTWVNGELQNHSAA